MSKEEFIKQKVEEGADEKELKALWEEYEFNN